MNKLVVIVAVSGLALAACGDDDGGSSAPSVSGAWARTSPMAADVGAAYFEIESADDDQLVAVTVSEDIAAEVQIHETVMSEMGDDMSEDTMAGDMTEDTMAGDMDEGDMAGTMTMQQIEALDLPAGETVVLEPGGYHLMLLGLTAPLELGQTFELTLDFAEADDLDITVEVRDEAP